MSSKPPMWGHFAIPKIAFHIQMNLTYGQPRALKRPHVSRLETHSGFNCTAMMSFFSFTFSTSHCFCISLGASESKSDMNVGTALAQRTTMSALYFYCTWVMFIPWTSENIAYPFWGERFYSYCNLGIDLKDTKLNFGEVSRHLAMLEYLGVRLDFRRAGVEN